mmetsp:Transcript_9188/g.11019  ORF Transcript_9188/g.11019 Transcript_9188/m.11019 type:complete len:696 (-) Transcript_9188:117-2204(-)
MEKKSRDKNEASSYKSNNVNDNQSKNSSSRDRGSGRGNGNGNKNQKNRGGRGRGKRGRGQGRKSRGGANNVNNNSDKGKKYSSSNPNARQTSTRRGRSSITDERRFRSKSRDRRTSNDNRRRRSISRENRWDRSISREKQRRRSRSRETYTSRNSRKGIKTRRDSISTSQKASERNAGVEAKKGGKTTALGNPIHNGAQSKSRSANRSSHSKGAHSHSQVQNSAAVEKDQRQTSNSGEGKSKQFEFSSQKQNSAVSWVDMDSDEDETHKHPNSLEREAEESEPERISAAARAIAHLQESVNRLTQENLELRDITSRQQMNLERECMAAAKFKADFEKKDQDYRMLEKINGQLGKLRTRLEAERESYRVQLNKSEREKKELLARINSGGGVRVSHESSDLNVQVKKLELELENSQSLLATAQKQISSLKIDIEYHQAQGEYLKICLENKEADIKQKDKDLQEMESLRSKLHSLMISRQVKGSVKADKDCEENEVNTKGSNRDSDTGFESKEEKVADSNVIDIVASKEDEEDQLSWLFSSSTSERNTFIKEMGYESQKDNVFILDALTWSDRNALLHDLKKCFSRHDFASLGPLSNGIAETEFWCILMKHLMKLCERDMILFINCKSSDTSFLPLEQEGILRAFISVLAEAYEECENPGQTLVSLEEWNKKQLGGEDVTGTKLAPKFHEIVQFETWK